MAPLPRPIKRGSRYAHEEANGHVDLRCDSWRIPSADRGGQSIATDRRRQRRRQERSVHRSECRTPELLQEPGGSRKPALAWIPSALEVCAVFSSGRRLTSELPPLRRFQGGSTALGGDSSPPVPGPLPSTTSERGPGCPSGNRRADSLSLARGDAVDHQARSPVPCGRQMP